jgi:hypothetical protein
VQFTESCLCGGREIRNHRAAVYNTVSSLNQIFLEHHDVEVDLAKFKAVVRNG